MKSDGASWVRFEVAGHQAAFPAVSVVEVVKLPYVTRIPLTPAYVLGAFLYRGKVVPIIDLSTADDVVSVGDGDEKKRLIVCCSEGRWLGFIIDRLIQIATLNGPVATESCNEPWSMLQGIVSGCVKSAMTTIFLLNLEAIIEILCNETPAYGGSRVEKESADR